MPCDKSIEQILLKTSCPLFVSGAWLITGIYMHTSLSAMQQTPAFI